MAIELKDVEHLAGLARIAVSDSEKELLRHDLEGILEYVSQIKEVKSPKYSMSKPRNSCFEVESGELRNVMREDGEPHKAGIFTEDILKQAPSREDNRISVKKIL